MPVDGDPQEQGQRQPTPLQSQLLLLPSQRESPLLPAPSREVQQQPPRLVPVPPQLMLPRQKLPPPQQQQQQQPLSWPQLLPGVFRALLSPPSAGPGEAAATAGDGAVVLPAAAQRAAPIAAAAAAAIGTITARVPGASAATPASVAVCSSAGSHR